MKHIIPALARARVFALILAVLSIAGTASAYGGSHWSAWAHRPWQPRDVPNATAGFSADAGITLGGTPRATGTTPPAVTYTGTLTGVPGLYAQIDGGGSRGVATFKWSLDGGSTFQATGVPTAATVTLSGAAASTTVNFPVGTYTTDNTYSPTVATWTDAFASATATQATAGAQPLLIFSGINGLPSIRGDGVDDILNTTLSVTQPSTWLIVYKSIVIGAGGSHDVIFADSAFTGLLSDSTPQYYSYNQGAGVLASGSAANGVFNCIAGVTNGVSSFMRRSFVQVASGSNGSATLGSPSFFGKAGGSRFTNVEIAAILFYSRALNATEYSAVEFYLKTKFGL